MKSSKKKALTVTLGTILMVVTIGITYAFINLTLEGTKRQVIQAGTLSLELDEDDNNLTIENALPMYDDVGMIQDAFTFRLINNGAAANYKLKLVEIGNGTLTKSDVKYGLTKDGVNKIGLLSDLESDGTIDSGVIGASPETIEYSLRLWVKDIVTDNATINGKSLSYRVDVEVGQIVEEYTLADELEQLYELSYYSDLVRAMAVINNSSYEDNTLTTTKEQAETALYMDENNIPNLVVLKDIVLDASIETSFDMILNLGGKNLTFNGAIGINVTSGDVTIDGTVDGSKISLANDNQRTTLAQVNNGSLTLNGGTYETISNNVGTEAEPNANILVGNAGILKAYNANITAEDIGDGTVAGILVETGGTAEVSNSNIEVSAFNSLGNDGIRNKGTMIISNTNVSGYGNYTANAAGTAYATNSRGINNEGTMTLKNCNVYGAHSGIRNPGTLYVDGGIYEGYGHGGIYFAGGNTTSYVKNATIRFSDMKVGYADSVAGTNSAGFYIGGAKGIVVYMDNCELSGPKYPMVLRSSGSESNNALYISNSNINEDRELYPRNDGSTNKIYIGLGNNFNIQDTYKESGSEETNVDYSTMFPEY